MNHRYPLATQIAEVHREIGARMRVYRRLVERKTMTQEQADERIDVMRCVHETLVQLAASDRGEQRAALLAREGRL